MPATTGKCICGDPDSHDGFHVTQAEDGKVKACWKGHQHEFASLEELAKADILNAHERSLLQRATPA